MEKNNRLLGKNYEKMAGDYLTSLGFEILAYNYQCKFGEIDIILRDGSTYVFCEVKYRKDMKMGVPEDAIDSVKRERIGKCAMMYLKEHYLWDNPCRFDVVCILGEELKHIRNAFEISY